MSSRLSRIVRRPGFIALLCLPALAVSTTFWRSSSFVDFSRGTLDHISVTREGSLSLAPELSEILRTDDALVWTMAADSQGNAYFGTGHRGRIYRLTAAMLASGKPVPPDRALLFTAPQPEIFALVVGPDGALYAGTSPDGNVYRITPDGKSSLYFSPHAKYIWSLAFSGDDLYVGTGTNGEIFKVTAAGHGAPFYGTQQAQVMSLATDHAGNLIAGTDPDGLIFRINPQGKGFVLYNSPLQEIHRVEVAADGTIFATAQGGAQRPALAIQALTPARPLIAGAGHGPGMVLDSGGIPPASAAAQNSPPNQSQAGPDALALLRQRLGANVRGPALTPSPFAPGALKSAVYRIDQNNNVDTLWSSKSEDVDDVLPSAAGLLLSTDREGRVYQLSGNRETTLLLQTNEEETTRLLRVGPYILATTSHLGSVFRVNASPATRGEFTSEVKDTGGISKWGSLDWRGTFPERTRVEFQTRTGNSERPNTTWSDWSPLHSDPGQPIQSPPARYIQWRAVLYAEGDKSPSIDEVVIPYLPENQAPEIESVTVRMAGIEGAETQTSGAPDGKVQAGPLLQLRPAGADSPRLGKGIRLSWNANDPDGDTLTYAVYFKGEGETAWKLLKKNLRSSELTVGGNDLPDGTYKFKVVASDEDSNPPALARTAEMVSAPATLDNTPPALRLLGTETSAQGTIVAHFAATDAISDLVRAEYSIDAGPWRQLYSDSGIIDSRQQSFTVSADHLPVGEHLLVLRVFDASGNQTSAKAVAFSH
jgi:hypothetical protein